MNCTILQGDALELLRTLPPESVHTCVTSPPYYNLRDYGVEGQIGNEGSVEEYLQALVAVFREVRRVLHPNGTLWVNVGDSYATNSGNQPPTNTRNSCGHTAKRVPQGYKKADAYASNPMWYQGGDNKNGESKLAKQSFFHTDGTFKIAEYMHFCNRLLKKEPKEKGQAPAMIVFCAFEQMQTVIEYGKRYGFAKSYPLFFCKNYSAQVLKANMKIVGATEFAVVLYRDKLPKFRNVGEDGGKHMVFDWFRWERDSRKEYPKIHPTQKPVGVLKRLIEVFTDPGDVVIDPVAGSGTTLRAAYELGRSAYGFEVDKSFYEAAREKMLAPILTETTTI